MKKLILLVSFLLLSSFLLVAQQAKRVYVTLDVSGSMWNDKYVLANYTAQMIVTLCDDEDEVYMLLYGKEKCLSKEHNPIKVIQKPVGVLDFGYRGGSSQFDDIAGFNEVYKPSKAKQDWLFIIGDGVWGTTSPQYVEDCEKFEKTVKDGNLNVCYLQTENSLNDHTDFTQFVETFGVVDIGKSDTNPQTIMKECDHFAKKILGFSEVSLKTKKSGKQCLSINAELPISEFILVYQDNTTPKMLPNISQVASDGKLLDVKLKGTPTTIPVKTNASEVDLSGNVWRVKAKNVITAGTEIEVCFDKAINLDNVSIYPIVEDVEFGGVCLSPLNKKLKQLNSNSYSICREENTAKVRIELTEESKGKLPEALLEKTKVVVKANNKEYKANYKNGGFECNIELLEEETQYYAECDCPGYLKRVTPITKIVKGDCEPETPQMDVKENSVKEFGDYSIEELRRNPIEMRITDVEVLKTLDPINFDLDVEVDNPFLYEDPHLSIKGDTIYLDLRPKGGWCECIFPKDLNFKVISTPKEGAVFEDGNNYTQTVNPIHINVLKNRSWLSRCFWVLLTIAGLILFVIYLRALLKKNRFKKYAMIKPSYFRVTGGRRVETLQGGDFLRKPGFGPWLNRWFNPFTDEQFTNSWRRPQTGSMTFVAADSPEVVNMTYESFKDNMTMPGFRPQQTKKKEELLIPMTGKIAVYSDKNKVKQDGSLVFDAGKGNDIGGFRVFLGVIIVADIVAIGVLLFFMVKAIL